VVTNCLKLKQRSRQTTLEMLAGSKEKKIETLPRDFLT